MITAFQSNAFQNDSFPIVVSSSDGLPQKYGKPWKKPKRIRYSDFETQEAYAAALAAIAMPIDRVYKEEAIIEASAEDEEDEILTMAILKVLH